MLHAVLRSRRQDGPSRVVAIDSATVTALRYTALRRPRSGVLCGPSWQGSGLVFVKGDGSSDGLRPHLEAARQACRRPQLRQVRFHDLRHSNATISLQAGVHPKVVSGRLGDSTTSLTLDVSRHAVPGLQEEAAENVSGPIAAACCGLRPLARAGPSGRCSG